jgi:hypothetical protein
MYGVVRIELIRSTSRQLLLLGQMDRRQILLRLRLPALVLLSCIAAMHRNLLQVVLYLQRLARIQSA